MALLCTKSVQQSEAGGLRCAANRGWRDPRPYGTARVTGTAACEACCCPTGALTTPNTHETQDITHSSANMTTIKMCVWMPSQIGPRKYIQEDTKQNQNTAFRKTGSDCSPETINVMYNRVLSPHYISLHAYLNLHNAL